MVYKSICTNAQQKEEKHRPLYMEEDASFTSPRDQYYSQHNRA